MKIHSTLIHKLTTASLTFAAATTVPIWSQDAAPEKKPAPEKCEDIRKSAQGIVGDVNSELTQLRLVIDSISGLQSQIKQLAAVNSKQKADMETLQKECAELKKSGDTSAATVASLNSEKQKLELSLKKAQTDANAQKETAGSLRLAKAAAATQLAAALKVVSEQKAAAKDQEKLSLQLQTLKTENTQVVQKQTQTIEMLTRKLQEQDAQMAKLVANLKTTTKRSDQLSVVADSAKLQAKKAENETCEIVTTLAGARAELNALNKKLQELATVDLSVPAKEEEPKK